MTSDLDPVWILRVFLTTKLEKFGGWPVADQ